MLCPNCQQEFDSTTNIPRILVYCGHTYCQVCIETIIKNDDQSKWSLNCPECGVMNQVADGVNSFPKNLVLLQVNNAPSIPTRNSCEMKIQEPTKQLQQSTTKQVCMEHNKKIEAFCEKDLQILCIDCILSEQHKSHDIINIQKAAEKQRQIMMDEVMNAQKTEEKLKFIHSDIKRHVNDMQGQAEKNRRELSQIYNYLRDLLLEREQALKRQISDNLSREEQECQVKLTEIGDFMQMITQIKNELVQQSQESEFDVLIKARQRQQLSSDVNGSKSKELVSYNILSTSTNSQSLMEIKRDQELIQISKIVNPQYKANVLSGIGSSLYSHTASTSNKLKKGSTVLQSQVSAPLMAQQVNLDSKASIKDDATRKAAKHQVKKSPHRNNGVAKKDNKKVMVLDQNKSAKNKGSKPLSSFNNVVSQNINLYNLNQQHNFLQNNQMLSQLDDQQESGIGPEDVSSIYPLETNECYFNYDNRLHAEQKRDESTGNLNDILECLNKSGMDAQDNQDVQRETSTASETGGSATEGTVLKEPTLKFAKSTIDTPKTHLNQWNHQKDNSAGDFEGQSKMQSPSKNNDDSEQQIFRSGSLQRFSSNLLKQQSEDVLESKTMDNQDRNRLSDENESNRKKQRGNQHQLQSLSKERQKRKVQRMSKENSPKKQKEENKQDLMMMLQECTKNIDKLEFKASPKKSPMKADTPKRATICMVDLTVDQEQPKQDEQNEVNDGFKEFIKSENVDDLLDEQKSPISTQSPIKLINACGDTPEKRISTEESQSRQQLATQQDLGCSMSVDTSVSDPFKALCRMKEEFIFVFSGFNDTKLLSCEVLDVSRGVWKEVCQVGKPRTKFSAVPISKSRILLFGGKQTDGQRTGEIEEYNLKTNKFKLLPFKMPKPRSGFAACVKRDEGKIFFCGGNSGNVLRKFDCLDLKKGKWSRLPEMIQKRDELAVALGPDGKVYAIGGYGGGSQQNVDANDKTPSSNCLRTAERYDFETGQWEMLPEMTEARRALAAVALPDGIYAIGGYDGKQYLSSVEKFDLQKQEWVPVKNMNTSRCTLSAVASSDCQYVYALGGFNGNALDLVERYNIMSDEWEFMTPMISKRFMHEAVSLVTQ